MYIKEVCVAGKVIEVRKFFSFRHHTPGMRRGEREKPTPEAQKKRNQKNAEKTLRQLMNTNFEDGDFLVRLDFCKRPGGSEEMQELMAAFIKKLRRYLKKEDQVPTYLYVKEVGPRGSRHIHMMLKKCDTDILMRAWTYGGVHIDPLNSGGQYRKIAAYFIKYAAKTEETEGRLIGKRWVPSQNLKKPKILRKVISARTFRNEVKEPKGYYLDKETEVSGISEETGYPYFSCQFVKIAGGGWKCRK